jgi:integrase
MSDPEDRTPLASSFDRYLQDKGKGRGGDGGNYRRNAERELNRFTEWAAGDRGDGWDGVVPDGVKQKPAFEDLNEGTFREYARHLASDRGLKQNTVQTYYAYISAWCGWCVNEGYLQSHYAQRASATAPLPEDDGRKPGDQQAWTPEHRHTLTRHVDEQAREAVESYTTLPEDTESVDKQRARYRALKTTRDRALVYLIAYTAVRVGELLRDPDDPRRRGIRWEDLNLEDGSMDVYRKKQQWDAASLPDPVIHPLRQYRELLKPPTDRWPVFPTFDQRSLGTLVQEELTDRGHKPAAVEDRRDKFVRDLLLALEEDIRPESITTDGARSMLRRLTTDAGVDVDHPRHEYLAPHGGRRGMGEVLVR